MLDTSRPDILKARIVFVIDQMSQSFGGDLFSAAT
jgi:hypothetical protein